MSPFADACSISMTRRSSVAASLSLSIGRNVGSVLRIAPTFSTTASGFPASAKSIRSSVMEAAAASVELRLASLMGVADDLCARTKLLGDSPVGDCASAGDATIAATKAVVATNVNMLPPMLVHHQPRPVLLHGIDCARQGQSSSVKGNSKVDTASCLSCRGPKKPIEAFSIEPERCGRREVNARWYKEANWSLGPTLGCSWHTRYQECAQLFQRGNCGPDSPRCLRR